MVTVTGNLTSRLKNEIAADFWDNPSKTSDSCSVDRTGIFPSVSSLD